MAVTQPVCTAHDHSGLTDTHPAVGGSQPDLIHRRPIAGIDQPDDVVAFWTDHGHWYDLGLAL